MRMSQDGAEGPQAAGFTSLLWPPGSSEANQCLTTYQTDRPFGMRRRVDNFPISFSLFIFLSPWFFLFFFLSRFLLCTAPSRPWRNEKGNKERLGIRDKTKDRSLPPSPFPTFDDWAAWEGSVTLKSCYESPRPHNFKTKCIAGPFHINFSHSTLCS